MLSIVAFTTISAGTAQAGTFTVEYGTTAAGADEAWTYQEVGPSGAWNRYQSFAVRTGTPQGSVSSSTRHHWDYLKPEGLNWVGVDITGTIGPMEGWAVDQPRHCSSMRLFYGDSMYDGLTSSALPATGSEPLFGFSATNVVPPGNTFKIGRYWATCSDSMSAGMEPMEVTKVTIRLDDPSKPQIALPDGIPATHGAHNLTVTPVWTDSGSGITKLQLAAGPLPAYRPDNPSPVFHEWEVAPGEITNLSQPGATTYSEPVTITPPVVSGTYAYNLTAEDHTGNAADLRSFQVTWDVVAPVVSEARHPGTSQQIIDGTRLRDPRPGIEWRVTDAEGNLLSVDATVDGTDVDVVQDGAGDYFRLDFETDLEPGDHNVVLNAIDTLGNQTAATLNFTTIDGVHCDDLDTRLAAAQAALKVQKKQLAKSKKQHKKAAKKLKKLKKAKKKASASKKKPAAKKASKQAKKVKQLKRKTAKLGKSVAASGRNAETLRLQRQDDC